jgi:hypothetical protein
LHDGFDEATKEQEDDNNCGSVFCFAYALPYTYGELLHDLEQTKNHLISIGGVEKNQQPATEPVIP